ncbi:hypothetical protein NHX12_020142 [Muraenolepis orangiensis]|uniref:Uncharacterized protein n=1 Tax=Muraenolepis orangiensis TaxID=630683 RepID=A0A9Q0IWR5_9TELE|nr:hypothetical protein NHX12_020142 [Muraenolepis orangiensis]
MFFISLLEEEENMFFISLLEEEENMFFISLLEEEENMFFISLLEEEENMFFISLLEEEEGCSSVALKVPCGRSEALMMRCFGSRYVLLIWYRFFIIQYLTVLLSAVLLASIRKENQEEPSPASWFLGVEWNRLRVSWLGGVRKGGVIKGEGEGGGVTKGEEGGGGVMKGEEGEGGVMKREEGGGGGRKEKE